MKIEKRKTRKGVINAVYKLFSDREHWTIGTDAADKYNNPVLVDDYRAVKFCIRGALRAYSANTDVYKDTYGCLYRLANRTGIVNLNDKRGYDAVMKLLEKGKTECK